MVVGAILFGVYGTPVVGRLSHGGGTPLADVLGDATPAMTEQVVAALQEAEQPDLHPEEARGILRQLMRRQVRVPDLSEAGYRLRRVAPVSLAGAPYRAAAITYRGEGDSAGRWMVVFVAADDGQYLSYDSLGRPRPMPPDLTLEGEMATPSGEPLPALVWSDGALLWVAAFNDADEAERMREPVGAP